MEENDDTLELVILEDYARAGKPVPAAKTYRIRIDKKLYDVQQAIIHGEEILKLADKTSTEWKLYQIVRGQQPLPIGPDQKVDLREPGIERFTTVPKDPSEGLVMEDSVKREFTLPENDTEYLDSLGLKWETVKKGDEMWLLIYDWHLPDGFNVTSATVALRIDRDYPDTQIDMAFFRPSLVRADGKGIANLADIEGIDGQWQQWSRHRTSANPWRPGIDDICSHLSLVDDWLRREFTRS